MGDATGISWTDHTFNAWWGCEHAPADAPEERGEDDDPATSPECDNCYAEAVDQRFTGRGNDLHWGATAPRRVFGDDYWAKPLRWNADAEAAGVRAPVFCSSMADVLERRPGELGRVLDEQRARLWHLIPRTPWLDWQLLTKRIENAHELLPWLGGGAVLGSIRWPDEWGFRGYTPGDPWPNVWLGTTCGVRRSLWRVRLLREVPAVLRFVSAEPLLEHITGDDWDDVFYPAGFVFDGQHLAEIRRAIHWLIVGDESGKIGARRQCQPDWVRTAREAAARHGVAFHFKQWNGPLANGIGGVTRGPGGKVHLPLLDNKQHAAIPSYIPRLQADPVDPEHHP